MELIGTVVRMQIQTRPLKPRPPGSGRYDPAALAQVSTVQVGPEGCIGDEGIVDVHHARHPLSRNVRRVNGISVLPRAHYDDMRQRYGQRLVDGAAGENLLLDAGRRLTADDLRGDLLLECDGGMLTLTDVMAAPPCLEFSQFCTGRDPGDDSAPVLAALEHLSGGMRGFYLRTADSGVVRVGAQLFGHAALKPA